MLQFHTTVYLLHSKFDERVNYTDRHNQKFVQITTDSTWNDQLLLHIRIDSYFMRIIFNYMAILSQSSFDFLN